MPQELKIVISAVGKGIEKTAGSLVSGLKRGSRAIDVFNRAAGDGGKIASGLAGQIKGLIGAYAGFSAISKTTQIVKDSETAVYNLQSSVNAANREFKNTGSVEDWERSVRKLSDELVIYSDTALRNAVSRTVDMTKRLGLSKEQMEEVIKRSADLAAGKTTLEGGIERVTAALRGEAEASEYLGLTLNETYVKSWYDAHNVTKKAWKDLKDIEKAQIRYKVLLEQSDALQGRAAGSARTFSGAVQLVNKEIENAITQNKDIVGAMNDLARILRENAGEIGLFVSQVVTAIAKTIEFVIKYKELLLAFAGTAVAVSVAGKLVTIIGALNAAFTVLTGMGILRWFSSLRAAIASTAASTTALGVAFKGFVAFAAAQGVINIVRAAKAFFEMRDAQKEAQKANERMMETSGRLMKKFEAFKDIKLPDNITGKAPEELEEFKKGLQKARAYYVALQTKLQAKSEETFLGFATKEALAARKELKKVNQRLNEINGDLKKVSDAGKEAGEGMKKPAEAVKATKEQLEDFEKQAKKAYENARSEAKKYAEEVIKWEEKIKYARMSTQDKIRELGRKGLSEEEQWNDKRLQAEEKLYAAREALRNKDYELAEKLARDAEGLYADLATEVKGTEAGNEVVKKSLEDTKKVAINGVKEVGGFIEELYGEQKQNAENSKAEWENTANVINAKLEEIAREREANVKIELKGVLEAQNTINDLIADETKHIKIKVTREVRTVEAKQTGGPVLRASTGTFVPRQGRLPGYGGGDKIRALLEAGEFVIRKEAVGKYGSAFFHALNAMRLNLPDLQGTIKARVGGLISGLSIPEIPVPAQRFAVGGPVTPTESMTIRLQAGNAELPLNVTGSNAVTRKMVNQFNSELQRMRLSRG